MKTIPAYLSDDGKLLSQNQEEVILYDATQSCRLQFRDVIREIFEGKEVTWSVADVIIDALIDNQELSRLVQIYNDTIIKYQEKPKTPSLERAVELARKITPELAGGKNPLENIY